MWQGPEQVAAPLTLGLADSAARGRGVCFAGPLASDVWVGRTCPHHRTAPAQALALGLARRPLPRVVQSTGFCTSSIAGSLS